MPVARRSTRPRAAPAWPDADWENLLNRAPRPVDMVAARRLIAGRAVLITGAGGSIGGTLARWIATLRPARLGLLDHSEYALWRTAQDVTETDPGLDQRPIIADIRDARRLRTVMEAIRPELVFHAAALKHLPMVQDHPIEGLLTNAIGTRNLADAARAGGVRTLVLVSTDKAVDPSSVMGASKRLAEMYSQALDMAARARGEVLRCVSLRFGNVLGSAGSVMELFARQIAHGGPLTLTHPDMHRFFIAPEEAIDLLLRAAALGVEDTLPPGAILVPEMGRPVRILDLATRMIRAAGLTPDRDIALRFTGPRAGEKLAEQACHGTESILPTTCPGLRAITPHAAALALTGRALDELEVACREDHPALALTLVSRLIPGFDPCHEGPAARLRA